MEGLTRAGQAAVVFEIGSAFIFCGFAGESQPRHVLTLEREKGNRHVKSKEEWQELLSPLIHDLYFSHLQINPHDRPAVVCTGLLTSHTFHEALAWAFFHYLQVPSVLFLSNEAIVGVPLRASTALMVDIGYREVRVLPIYEGALQIQALQTASLAGEAINTRILELLQTDAQVLDTTTNDRQRFDMALSETVLEDIKIRRCRVSTKGETQREIEEVEEIIYPLCSEKVLVMSPVIVSKATEVLFEMNDEDESLCSLILEALKRVPYDTRCLLAQNILLIGGTAMLDGMKERLLTELEDLVLAPGYTGLKGLSGQFCTIRSMFAVNLLSWLGGSVVGCVEHKEAVTLKNYMENHHKLPDWARIQDTSKKQKKGKTIKGPFELTPTPLTATSAGTKIGN